MDVGSVAAGPLGRGTFRVPGLTLSCVSRTACAGPPTPPCSTVLPVICLLSEGRPFPGERLKGFSVDGKLAKEKSGARVRRPHASGCVRSVSALSRAPGAAGGKGRSWAGSPRPRLAHSWGPPPPGA